MSDPREVEASASSNTVEFRGETFTVPLERGDWSVDMVESLEEGKIVGIIRGSLGPDQWRTVKGMDLKMRDLAELSDLIAKAMGFGDVGESTASSA